MSLCKTCGVPSILSRDQKWNANGTITIPKEERFRLVMLESVSFIGLLRSLEVKFGEIIGKVMTQATKKNAKLYVDALLSGPLGLLARSVLGGKKVYNALAETTNALGYGKTTIEKYERKKLLAITIVDTIYPPHFLGDGRGAFESVERVPSKGTFQLVEQGPVLKHFFEVKRAKKDDEISDALNFQADVAIPCGVEMPRCQGCGLPMGLVERFKWDFPNGKIMDTKTGDRVFLMGFNDVVAVLRELENLVGELVPHWTRELNVRYGRNFGKRIGANAHEIMASEIGLKGMGYAKVQVNGEEVSWTITNPFYVPMLEGRLLGLYEGVYGKQPKKQLMESAKLMHMNLIPKA
jgi:hypothetical protein